MHRNRHYTFLILALLCMLLIGAYSFWKKHRLRSLPLSLTPAGIVCRVS